MSQSADARPAEEIPLEERVQAHMLQDLPLADSVSRGLANLGRTAHRLQRVNGWDEAPAEIVRVLRGYVDEDRLPPLEQGRRVLKDSHVDLHARLALLTVSNYPHIRERLEDAWVPLATAPRASIVDYEDNLRIILSDRAVEEIRGILPEGSVIEEQRPVCAIVLRTPDERGSMTAVWAVVAAFFHREIPVLHVAATTGQGRILVPDENEIEAHRLMLLMTGSTKA